MRWIPFFGIDWVYCTEEGKVVPDDTSWQIKALCVHWQGYGYVLALIGKPELIIV